jgi:hypothetical protein
MPGGILVMRKGGKVGLKGRQREGKDGKIERERVKWGRAREGCPGIRTERVWAKE